MKIKYRMHYAVGIYLCTEQYVSFLGEGVGKGNQIGNTVLLKTTF